MNCAFYYTSRVKSFILVIVVLIICGICSVVFDICIRSNLLFWTIDIINTIIVYRLVSHIGMKINFTRKEGFAYICDDYILLRLGRKEVLLNPDKVFYCENTPYNKILGVCWDLMFISGEGRNVTIHANRNEIMVSKEERTLYLLTKMIAKKYSMIQEMDNNGDVIEDSWIKDSTCV